MPAARRSQKNRPPARAKTAQAATEVVANNSALLPLGAMLLAGSLGTAAYAQNTTPAAPAPATAASGAAPASGAAAGTLPTVTVRDTAEQARFDQFRDAFLSSVSGVQVVGASRFE